MKFFSVFTKTGSSSFWSTHEPTISTQIRASEKNDSWKSIPFVHYLFNYITFDALQKIYELLKETINAMERRLWQR